VSRSVIYYESVRCDKETEAALLAKAEDHPREGFWKAYGRLRLDGKPWNHKRLHRVYVKLGLPLRRKAKKRLPARPKMTLVVPSELNDTCSIDFMQDRLENGRKVRCFNVIDDANREIIFVDIDYSLKSQRVLWVLNHLMKKRAKPKKVRMDNGPEFIAHLTQFWSHAHDIQFLYIQPGEPTQNAYIERFNGSFRRGVLDAFIFQTIEEVREEAEKWVDDYNNFRPHDSLKRLPPTVYAKRYLSNTN